MTRCRWPLIPLFMVLLSMARMAPAAEGPVILFPPDLTLSHEEKIKVFAYRKGKSAQGPIIVNGKRIGPIQGDVFLRGELSLKPGLNIVKDARKTIRIYFLPRSEADRHRVSAGQGKAPLIFRSMFLHHALEEGCEGCHTIQGGQLWTKDPKESCYACHNDFGKDEEGVKKFLHEPVAAGECTSCHNPHFSPRPRLLKLEKGCQECHDAFPREGYVHSPLRTGKCTDCHNPHASVSPKLLVRAGNALCRGCHKSIHDRHSAAARTGPMTRLPEDFPRDGQMLACTGCHSPHQSSHPQLLLKDEKELCNMCHPR